MTTLIVLVVLIFMAAVLGHIDRARKDRDRKQDPPTTTE